MNTAVELPLSPDIMVEFFKDKSKRFLIDYDKSLKLSPKSMLVYLSNLQIECDFTRISKELIIEYIQLKDICYIDELNVFLADCLYFIKYNKPYMNSLLFQEYGLEIIKEYKHILIPYSNILDSSTSFLFSTIKNDKIHIDINENVKMESPDKLGFCFLNLYKIPDFLITYLEDIKPLEQQIFYTDIFNNDNYKFKGNNLFHYISCEENLFYKFMLISLNAFVYEESDSMEKIINLYGIFNKDIK